MGSYSEEYLKPCPYCDGKVTDDWKGKFAWTFSFDEVCYELGVKSPKDKMDGSLVHKYYWQSKFEEIKTYCEKDVSSSIEVSKKLYKK
jgi:predicted PolB exonuclease-like 3'-5' exonuclease